MDRVGRKVLETPEVSKLILHDFDPLENRDAIMQYGVLNEYQVQEVEAERVPYKRKNIFYDLLRKEPQGYANFMKVLREKEMFWLVELLEKERGRLEAAGGVRFALDDFDDKTRARKLSERELMELAEHIRTKWEEIACALDFSQAQIYDIKMQGQNMGSLMTATNMFVQFTRREPGKANLNFFIPKLEERGVYLEKKDVDKILNLD